MRLKDDSVETFGTTPEILIALFIADQVYAERGCNMEWTSGSERTVEHSRQSSHWRGQAIDLSVKDLMAADPRMVPAVTAEIRERLNKHYQVIFEGDHIHIQYRPKH